MPNDVVTLNALRFELGLRLDKARVDKIFMPEKDELHLLVRAGGKNERLVISCNSQNPRIHLSSKKKENPTTAQTFCMLCRKHLSNGIIDSVKLLNNDRIFDIVISNRNEMGDLVDFHIVFEFMGRYSNILLCDGKYKILDAIKRVSFDAEAKRCILPSAKYLPPSYTKVPHNDKIALKNLLTQWDLSGDITKFLASKIAGIATETAVAILADAKLDKKFASDPSAALSDCEIDCLIESFMRFAEIAGTDIYQPSVSLDSDKKPVDYYVYAPQKDFERAENLLCAIERCLEGKDNKNRHQENTKHLQNAIKKHCNRHKNTLRRAADKLDECEKAEIHKIFGDLITSNLYALKKGDKILKTVNFYDEACQEISLPLNERLTPQQNAQACYKKYAKLKRTKDMLEQQIKEVRQNLDYLESIECSLSTSVTKEDFSELERELSLIGVLPKQKQQPKKGQKPSAPLQYEIEGLVLLVGKNNIQNDNLTFKIARGGDIWFHTKKTHGSHCLMMLENNQKPSSAALQTACEIASFYSRASQSDKTECDYTIKKFVKRHPIGSLGMTTYTNQTTMVVKPCAHLDLLK